MRPRRHFRPSTVEFTSLEPRLALHGASNSLGAPVLLQGLNAPKNAFAPHTSVATSALVDLAFQSFQQDYSAARATYLAAVANGTATAADQSAFTNFTHQRVSLLATQVVNSLLVYNASTQRGHRSSDPLPTLSQKLISSGDNKAVPRSSGTLDGSLVNSTPPFNASPTTVSLDTFAQDNAIAASQVTVLNGITLIRSGFASGGKTNA
jgi:hypothetical protein